MPKSSPSQPAGTGDQTRMALIEAAIGFFGVKGFEATSTREIAAAADANIASIAYHFGGKDGLRIACAEMVVGRIRSVVGEMILASDPGGDPVAAARTVEVAAMGMADFLLARPEAHDIAAFMVREVANPGVVLDRIYTDLIFPVHSKLCQLLGLATGQEPEGDLIRLGAFSIAGQIVYFRIGHALVARRMQWQTVGPDEIGRIKAVILSNIRAFIAANTKVPS